MKRVLHYYFHGLRLLKDRRDRCRGKLKPWALLYAGMLFLSPFVMNVGAEQPVAKEVFGMDADIVKGAFALVVIVLGWLVARILIRVDRNQATLFDNQRKLSVTLAQLITAHNLNHKQPPIGQPNLSDSGE